MSIVVILLVITAKWVKLHCISECFMSVPREIMRWILFKCILLAGVAVNLGHERPKRDLLDITNYLTSMMLGVNTAHVDIDEKAPQRSDRFKLFTIPGFDNVLINLKSQTSDQKIGVPVSDTNKLIEINPENAIIGVRSLSDNLDDLKIIEEVTAPMIRPQEHSIMAHRIVPLKTTPVFNDETEQSLPSKHDNEYIIQKQTPIFPAVLRRSNQVKLTPIPTEYSFKHINSDEPGLTYIANNRDMIIPATMLPLSKLRVQDVASMCGNAFQKGNPFEAMPTIQMSEYVPLYQPIYNIPRFYPNRHMLQYFYPSMTVTVKPPTSSSLRYPFFIGDSFDVAASLPFRTDNQILKNIDYNSGSNIVGDPGVHFNHNPVDFGKPLPLNHIYQSSFMMNARQSNPLIASVYSNPDHFHKLNADNYIHNNNEVTSTFSPYFTNKVKNEKALSANTTEIPNSVEIANEVTVKNVNGQNEVNPPKPSVLFKEPVLTGYVYKQIYHNPNELTAINAGDQITESNRLVNNDGKIDSQLPSGYVLVSHTINNKPTTVKPKDFKEAISLSSQAVNYHGLPVYTAEKLIETREKESKDAAIPLTTQNTLKSNPIIVTESKINNSEKQNPNNHTSITIQGNSDAVLVDVKRNADIIYTENKNRGDIPDGMVK